MPVRLCVHVHVCLHTRLLVCVNWPPPSTSKVYEMKVESLGTGNIETKEDLENPLSRCYIVLMI